MSRFAASLVSTWPSILKAVAYPITGCPQFEPIDEDPRHVTDGGAECRSRCLHGYLVISLNSRMLFFDSREQRRGERCVSS